MGKQASFVGRLQRFRLGNGDADREVVGQFEPEVRRVIHVRMTDPQLYRQLDSVDIRHSMMGDFFVRFAEVVQRLMNELTLQAKDRKQLQRQFSCAKLKTQMAFYSRRNQQTWSSSKPGITLAQGL